MFILGSLESGSGLSISVDRIVTAEALQVKIDRK